MDDSILNDALDRVGDNIDQEVANFLESFQNEVIKKHFPQGVIGGSGYTTSAGVKPDQIAVKMHSQQYVYKGTSFFYPAQNKKFLHYTRFSNFVEILKSRSIRLYDFNNFNDPSEFFFSELIKSEVTNDLIPNDKGKLFAFSFNESKEEDFNMWRLYGDDGNGVAFEFEFLGSEREQDTWGNHFLSEVKYDESEGELVNKFILDCKEFFERNNYARIPSIKSFILPILGSIKRGIYQDEKEIRLLSVANDFFYNGLDSLPYYNYSLSREGSLVKYCSIPISDFKDYEALIHANKTNVDMRRNAYLPHVSLTKIIIGYRADNSACEKKRKMIRDLLSHYNYRNWIEITSSEFRSYFKNN